MALLREIFGPSKDQVWRQLCNEMGGEFTDRTFFRASKFSVRVKQWTITLDTYTSGDSDSSTTYTRMRAPYVNPDGFRFEVYRHGWSSGVGKFLGMQDIEVGVPDFDADFVIKGNDESKVRQLFSNPRIRQMIQYQPSIHLQVKDDEGWFGEIFPEGVDELHFEVTGVLKDSARLKALFELFAETLNHLCHIGAAYENDPRLSQSVRLSSQALRQAARVCLVAVGVIVWPSQLLCEFRRFSTLGQCCARLYRRESHCSRPVA